MFMGEYVICITLHFVCAGAEDYKCPFEGDLREAKHTYGYSGELLLMQLSRTWLIPFAENLNYTTRHSHMRMHFFVLRSYR